MTKKTVCGWVLAAVCAGVSMVSGCSCEQTKQDIDSVADEATGAAAVRRGEELKTKLQDINQAHQQQLENATE